MGETGQGRSDVAYGNDDDDVRFDINEENLKGSHEGYQIEGDANEAKMIDEKLAKAAAEEAGDNFANTSDETPNEKYERDQVDQGLAESIQSDEGMLADSGQKDKVEEGKVNAIMAEKKAITGEAYGRGKLRNESTLDKAETVMVDTKIKNFLSAKNPSDEKRHHTEATKESASVIRAAKKSQRKKDKVVPEDNHDVEAEANSIISNLTKANLY